MEKRINVKIRSLAARALAEALQYEISEDIISAIESHGVRVEIRLSTQRTLVPCEVDLLDLVAAQVTPISQEGIIDAFARAEIIHGDSTVRRCLSQLVKRGLLINRGRRGYEITEEGKEALIESKPEKLS